MKKTIFLYSGEGTHGPETRSDIFRTSEKWHEIKTGLLTSLDLDLESVWQETLGKHTCPFSPLRTLISQICLADIWSGWGYVPDIVMGHSTGELAAAFEAGFYSLEQALSLAHNIGLAGANMQGRMAHGWMADPKESEIHISSINFRHKRRGIHVTLSDIPDRLDPFLKENPDFIPMPLPHPWHHPDYAPYAAHLKTPTSVRVETGRFISGLTGQWETCLPDTHWRDWMVRPIDFIAAMDTLKNGNPNTQFSVIEIGAHPVLAPACRGLGDYIHVPSLSRGEPDQSFILAQRRKLEG